MRIITAIILSFITSYCFGQNDNYRLFNLIKKNINPEVPIVDAFTPPWPELISGLPISENYKQKLYENVNMPCKANIQNFFSQKTTWINYDSANKYLTDPGMVRPSNVPRGFYFFTCPMYSDDIAIIHLIAMGSGWATYVFRKNKKPWLFRLSQPKWKLESKFR